MNFTLAHEAGHWVLNRQFATGAGDSSAKRTAILCRKRDAKKPAEWQADYFAACLLVPEKWVRWTFENLVGSRPLRLHNDQRSLSGFMYIEPCVCNWPFIARAVQETGGFSNYPSRRSSSGGRNWAWSSTRRARKSAGNASSIPLEKIRRAKFFDRNVLFHRTFAPQKPPAGFMRLLGRLDK